VGVGKKWISKVELLLEQQRPKPRYRTRNQKAINAARARSAELTLRRDGRWRCDDCREWHYDGEECPLTSVAVARHIERELARAVMPRTDGLSYRDSVLHQAATTVNAWAETSEAAAWVRDGYLRHPVIGPFLRGEIKERGFWDEDKRKPKPKTISVDSSKIDYLLEDKIRKPARNNDSRPDGWFDYHARPSRQAVKVKEIAKSRRRVPRTLVPDWVLQKLSHRQRVVYEMTVLAEPPAPIAEVAAELGIPDQSQISRIKRQAIERVTKLLARKSVK
jgi:hypothetical protein